MKYALLKNVKLLSMALTKQSEYFKQHVDEDILDYVSIPQIGEILQFKWYDESSASIHTFSEEFGHIQAEIRNGLTGGLNCIFKSHIACAEHDQYPAAAHSINGERNKFIYSICRINFHYMPQNWILCDLNHRLGN